MRLVSRVLRDVQLKSRPVSRLRTVLVPLHSRPCIRYSSRSAVRAGHGIHPFSTGSSLRSVADYDLIHSELSQAPELPVESGVAPPGATSRALIQKTRAFRKWSALLLDPARLAFESDFFRQGPAKHLRKRLLVDKFEHHGDLALWACLLDYQMRMNGTAGVLVVWKALWGRKTLYDVDGPLADMFWRIMLEGALMSNNPSILENIWVYSEWIHLLRTHQHQQVLQWHLRLAHNFYPGPDELASIIKEFALDKELRRLDILPSLYRTSPKTALYNTLLPHLFNQGESNLARQWRHVLVQHGEEPLAPAPIRPFLRFMAGYYPHDTLTGEELAALRFTTEPPADEKPEISREFVNRVHGRTFGITVKNYNDSLGAKWFASSWARNIPLNVEEASHIYDSLIEDYNLSQRAFTSQPAAFYLSIFRQLKSMDMPVPLSHWKLLMLSMARRGRQEDVARLSIELVDMFISAPSLRPGFVPIHVWDLPEAMRGPLGGVENLLGVYIPQDIPTRHKSHPLREIFDSKMMTEIIQNAFVAHPGQGFRAKSDVPQRGPQSQVSQIANMISLLRILNERGMWLRFWKIRFIVTNCLIDIYGPVRQVDTRRRMMRAANTLTLTQMKTLIDTAWGDELLPTLEGLAIIIQRRPSGASLDSRKLSNWSEH
ncbi:hypothetical protein ONZ43_g2674 [Nemania bipapillata]|uniref:Uncharacterized protein n=1 Tax=Nemania bipapillata TaxID=110536 RepID=A0ACC2IZN5_9PEZI|nr:hypothetical protein ONZ43_g2674 [Nemania bipapillata]